MMVVVTCVVLWPTASGEETPNVLSTGGWGDCAGALLELGGVTSVGFEETMRVVNGELGELLAGAAGALGPAKPGHFKSIRGLCVVGSRMPQSG
jgi:hypothetical protein